MDRAYRGMGVFEGIFRASLAQYAGKYPVMLNSPNQMNPCSYAAHTRKARMSEIGTFDFNDNHYWMLGIKVK